MGWIKQLLCRHVVNQKPLIVSGYGYTQYELTFCERCEKLIWKQTRSNQD